MTWTSIKNSPNHRSPRIASAVDSIVDREDGLGLVSPLSIGVGQLFSGAVSRSFFSAADPERGSHLLSIHFNGHDAGFLVVFVGFHVRVK